MQQILTNLSDMLIGAGALIVTIAICLFFKACGFIVEDHERGQTMALKTRAKLIAWCIGLFVVEIWGVYYHISHQ